MNDDQETGRERELLRRLPDDVAHVEARGLLLGAAPTVIVGADDPESGFVLAPLHGLAAGYGRPGAELAERLEQTAGALGLPADELELHLHPGVARAWVAAGEATHDADAVLHAWDDGAAAALSSLSRHTARLLTSPEDPALDGLPRKLRAELRGLAAWPRAAVSLAGDQAACVAYAFVETEGLWDVSIDTQHQFRREGFATSCAAFLIADQLARGKRPVWGSDARNAASLALAARMGFRPAAEQTILRRRVAR